jgi:peptide deformylase
MNLSDIRLVKYPDPLLTQKLPDYEGDLATAAEIGKRMLAIMKNPDYPGVGLAGNQANVPYRIIVVNYTGKPQHDMICVNPVITEETTDAAWETEGCLSLPGIHGMVARPSQITVEFTDPISGPKTMRPKGFLARIFLHEIDHLNGIQIIDKFSAEDLDKAASRLKALEEEYTVRA